MDEIKHILDMIEVIHKDGLTYAVLPNKMSIYRGDSNKYFQEQQTNSSGSPLPKKELYNKETVLDTTLGSKSLSHKYFGLTENNVMEYGKDSQMSNNSTILSFITNSSIMLLRMDDITTKKKMIDIIENKSIEKNKKQHLIDIINKNFGGESNVRITQPVLDGQLVDFLCEEGYEGYLIGSEMIDIEGNLFHAEIALCKRTFEKLDYNDRKNVIIHDSNDSEYENIDLTNVPSPVLMQYDDDTSPVSSPYKSTKAVSRKLAFGGKKRKTKKKKRTRSNRKKRTRSNTIKKKKNKK